MNQNIKLLEPLVEIDAKIESLYNPSMHLVNDFVKGPLIMILKIVQKGYINQRTGIINRPTKVTVGNGEPQ